MSSNQSQTNEILEPLYPQRRGHILAHWRTIFKNIRDYRFFIRQLVSINILKDFKRSFVGLLWLFILPIVSVIIWILLNGAGVVNPGDTGIPYPAYVLLSTSIWGFFIEIYRNASNVISSNGRMMTMNRFPHEVFVVEQILVHLIRFIIPFVVNLAVLLLFGVKFTLVALLFPLTLIPLLLLGIAIGLFVSLLRIVAVDISGLIDEGMKFLMFLTPIVYAPKIKVGWFSEIIHLNPLTYLVGFSRNVLTEGTFYEPQNYLICVAATLVLFLVSTRIFVVTEPKVLERLINN